jgi:protoheme IX farnesyltransferase
MLKEYYRLTKPGIVYGNALTTLAAYLFASGFHIRLLLFVATLLGISLVVASACVFNNYLDRAIDRKMARTKDRALAAGTISAASALAYGSLLGLIGFGLLWAHANSLTALIALFGWVMYVFVYGWAKRAGSWGTLVGSIPGAVPIVVGYTAVTGALDATALILFLILVFWQMPHFYAIAIYRESDYAAAGIPVLPIKSGVRATKRAILFFLAAFFVTAPLLTLLGYAGYAYCCIMLVVGAVWLALGIKGFKAPDDIKWARGVFFASLFVLLAFSAALAIAPLLP